MPVPVPALLHSSARVGARARGEEGGIVEVEDLESRAEQSRAGQSCNAWPMPMGRMDGLRPSRSSTERALESSYLGGSCLHIYIQCWCSDAVMGGAPVSLALVRGWARVWLSLWSSSMDDALLVVGRDR